MKWALIACCSLLAGAAATAAEPAPLTLLQQIDAGFSSIFEKAAPAVVVIEADKQGADPEDGEFGFNMPEKEPQAVERSEGSGFIVRTDGAILTNYHVIAKAKKITVKLKDGREFPASILGADDKTDIAALKIDAKELPVLELGDSDAVKIGQLVCSIGVPFKLDYSFSCGWVSAKGRSELTSTTYEDYIQTDSFINPGNSGGPLLDVRGRVVGMNTLINGLGSGVAFAIPASMLRNIGGQLIDTGKVERAWLGVRIQALSQSEGMRARFPGLTRGVVVETIEPDTPAYRSDLRPADVVTELDGITLETARDLQREVLKRKVGTHVKLTVWREGKTFKVPLELAELRGAALAASNPLPAEKPPTVQPGGRGGPGIELQDLTPELAKHLGVRAADGALVTDVVEGSAAERAGVLREDLITEVDHQPVVNAAQAKALLGHLGSAKTMLLFLDRRGVKTFVVVKAL